MIDKKLKTYQRYRDQMPQACGDEWQSVDPIELELRDLRWPEALNRPKLSPYYVAEFLNWNFLTFGMTRTGIVNLFVCPRGPGGPPSVILNSILSMVVSESSCLYTTWCSSKSFVSYKRFSVNLSTVNPNFDHVWSWFNPIQVVKYELNFFVRGFILISS